MGSIGVYCCEPESLCLPCSMAAAQHEFGPAGLIASERRRKQRYGVTLKQLLDRNGHDLCEICEERPAICVDHHHRSGLVRGALCRSCNGALHYIENLSWLRRAQDYLHRRGHNAGDAPPPNLPSGSGVE